MRSIIWRCLNCNRVFDNSTICNEEQYASGLYTSTVSEYCPLCHSTSICEEEDSDLIYESSNSIDIN